MVAIELHQSVVPLDEGSASSSPPSATTIVWVSCVNLGATIRVEDRLTGKTVERAVDLGVAAAVARPHLLALSIVESVAASSVELQSELRPTQAPPNAVAAATPESRAAAPDVVASRVPASRPPRLVVGPIVQSSTAGPLSLGGAVSLAVPVGARFGWLMDFALQHGQQTFALGRIIADTASALGAVTARMSRGPLTLDAGLGGRVGRAWLSGTPVSPAFGDTLRGTWWGPAAVARGSMTFRRRLVVELSVEAGYVVLPVVALIQGSGESVAIDGAWIRGGLGVGAAF